MTTLEEKVLNIIYESDFNNLPVEERKRICKYTAEQQILTLWQTLCRFPEETTSAWKRKQEKWLATCVNEYRRKYGYGGEDT